MLPSSLAFAWGLWRQHRWGLAVVLSYLVVAGLASAVLPAHFSGSQAGSVFTNVALPLFFLPVYVLVVFTYGLEIGELNTRESCFPPRLLRLPLPTAAVAWWMLLYGAAIVILLWLAIAGLILRPWLGARWNESAALVVAGVVQPPRGCWRASRPLSGRRSGCRVGPRHSPALGADLPCSSSLV